VGEVRVTVELLNHDDVRDVARGLLSSDAVRRAPATLLVDTGSQMLVLPRDVVELLGLEMIDRSIVEYADGRREEVDVAGMVRLSVSGRIAIVPCVVGPAGTEPLLGQIVLEMMDLLVDCGRNQRVARPESPHVASYKLK